MGVPTGVLTGVSPQNHFLGVDDLDFKTIESRIGDIIFLLFSGLLRGFRIGVTKPAGTRIVPEGRESFGRRDKGLKASISFSLTSSIALLPRSGRLCIFRIGVTKPECTRNVEIGRESFGVRSKGLANSFSLSRTLR